MQRFPQQETTLAVSRAVSWREQTPGKTALWLFKGKLAARDLDSVLHRQFNAALTARLVTLSRSGAEWIPTRLLQADADYTWVAADGAHELIHTRQDEVALRRIWPAASDSGVAVYCEELGRETAGAEATLVTSALDVGAEWRRLAGYPECLLRLGNIAESRCWHGPVRGLAFDPTGCAQGAPRADAGPPDAAPPPTNEPCCPRNSAGEGLACAGGGLAGCVEVVGDQLVVSGPQVPSLWLAQGALRGVVWLEAFGRGVFSSLLSDQESEVELSVYGDSGEMAVDTVSLQAEQPALHVVINEVMFDPVGPEPAQEWVELSNWGAQSVNLGGWRFGDEAADAELPEATLEPGGYVLLVKETFDPGNAPELVPEVNVPLLRLSQLGKGGLANSGEALHLSDPWGKVVSRFPPTLAPTPGASVARRAPWVLDEDRVGFDVHASPGSSPGRRNTVGWQGSSDE